MTEAVADESRVAMKTETSQLKTQTRQAPEGGRRFEIRQQAERTILDVILVIPELRPRSRLDGGRFATST